MTRGTPCATCGQPAARHRFSDEGKPIATNKAPCVFVEGAADKPAEPQAPKPETP